MSSVKKERKVNIPLPSQHFHLLHNFIHLKINTENRKSATIRLIQNQKTVAEKIRFTPFNSKTTKLPNRKAQIDADQITPMPFLAFLFLEISV
jgi:hypothetical protein